MSSSPYDAHHDHSRPLTDHRSNRFDVDDRFSTLSQFSDTPSVYSPAHFSPRHQDAASRQRLHDTQTGAYGLEEDRRCSEDISVYDDDARSSDDDQRPQTEENDPRLSYLGPKMRFHSRAPWEMDEGILEEVEPAESPAKHHAFPFSLGAKTHRSTGSSSPRPSMSRPSGESARSHLVPKRSFDTINSQMSSKGALYALAQESLSSASLSKALQQKDGLLGKLSSSLSRARGNSSASSPASPELPSRRLNATGRAPPLPKHAHQDSVMSQDFDPFAAHHQGRFATAKPPTPPAAQDVHPYANPDLIRLAPNTDRDSGYLSTFPNHTPIRNDSNITVTQSFEPITYVASRTSLSSTTGGTRNRISSINGREISSPVAVQASSFPHEMSAPGMEGQPVGANNLPGWKEKFVPPAFTLISLEEARAQRSGGGPPPAANDSTPTHSVADLSRMTMASLQSEDSISTLNHEPMAMHASRNRGRTTSTGAKATKNVFQSMVGSVLPERRDSEAAVAPSQPAAPNPPPHSLKHKKSGFMRIFNGGKDKEADALARPPVPSNSTSSDILSVNKKSSASRVPVPSYTQPPSDSASTPSLSTSSSISSSPDIPRRIPPSLFIETGHQGTPKRHPSDRKADRAMSSLAAPKPWMDSKPQSAPADVTGFPSLKLRPTSGLFSSHFEDIVPDFHSFSTMETPGSSNSNPSDLTSPITPATSDRFYAHKPDADGCGEMMQTTTTTSQRRIRELEAEVRAMRVELEELRSAQRHHPGYCDSCGRGGRDVQVRGARAGSLSSASSSLSNGSAGDKVHSVLNRPRAKTATTARFVNHNVLS